MKLLEMKLLETGRCAFRFLVSCTSNASNACTGTLIFIRIWLFACCHVRKAYHDDCSCRISFPYVHNRGDGNAVAFPKLSKAGGRCLFAHVPIAVAVQNGFRPVLNYLQDTRPDTRGVLEEPTSGDVDDDALTLALINFLGDLVRELRSTDTEPHVKCMLNIACVSIESYLGRRGKRIPPVLKDITSAWRHPGWHILSDEEEKDLAEKRRAEKAAVLKKQKMELEVQIAALMAKKAELEKTGAELLL